MITFEVCQFCGKVPVGKAIRTNRDGTPDPDGPILFCCDDCRLTALELAGIGGDE